MTEFREQLIEEEFSKFYEAIRKQFAVLGIDAGPAKGRLHLRLDDKPITDKKDLSSTHGRYYFRVADNWMKAYIPHAESSGVYFFFDESGVGLYVGKSEVPGGLGERVASHVNPYDNGRFPALQFPEAEYIIVLPFDKAPFLAVAFESYLLSKYHFKYNKQMNKT